MLPSYKGAMEKTKALLGGREGFHQYVDSQRESDYVLGREILRSDKFFTLIHVEKSNPSVLYVVWARS